MKWAYCRILYPVALASRVLRLLAIVLFAILSLGQLAPDLAKAQTSAAPYTSGYRYDVLRRLVGQISAPSNAAAAGTGPYLAVRYTYDADGQLLKTESGSLATWQSESVVPANWSGFTVNQTTDYFYDAFGNKIRERVSANGTIHTVSQFAYDSNNRPICTMVRMNSATFGTLANETPAANPCVPGTAGAQGADRVTKTIYDVAGQILQVRQAVGTPREQAYVTNDYTPNGKKKHVIDAGGNRARLEYDGFDRQSKWIFPSPAALTPAAVASYHAATPGTALTLAGAINPSDYEEYSYDANGNRTSLRKRESDATHDYRIIYTYDALNRVTVKQVPDRIDQYYYPLRATTDPNVHARNVFYKYDLRGLMLEARFDSASGPDAVLTQYDKAGRIAASTLAMDGQSRTLRSCYDANGNRTRLGYPDVAPGTGDCAVSWTNNYLTYDFDGLNRAQYIKANGTQLTLVDYRYSTTTGRLESEYRGNSAWGLTAWFYDGIGRVNGMQRNLYGTTTDYAEQFAYNPASQVTYKTMDNDAYAYTARIAVNRPYSANGLNQYAIVAGTSFCHDRNGNLIADGTYVYRYDAENRLVEKRAKVQTRPTCPTALADYAGELQVQLRYDPMGRLYESTGNVTGVTRFVMDGDALVGEYDSAGIMTQRYVHGADGKADDPVAQYRGSVMSNATLWFLQRDRLGSINATSDLSTTPARIFAYDEWGIPQAKDGAALIPSNGARFLYTGQAWIPDLGMYYYKARIYSPTLGRFMQTDPIGYDDQINLYSYVGNDPLNLVDVTGQRADRPRTVLFDPANPNSTTKGGGTRPRSSGRGTGSAKAAGWVGTGLLIAKILDAITPEPVRTVKVYRVYGGEAEQRGSYWTTTDPRQYKNEDEARQSLALLPEWGNTMRRVAEGQVDARNIAEEGIAAPQASEDGTIYKGGATELRVIDYNKVVITNDEALRYRGLR